MKYRSLPAWERAAFLMMSAIYVPASPADITKALVAAGESMPNRKKWTPGKLESMLKKWEAQGIAHNNMRSGGILWFCDRLLTEPAIREAIKAGEIERLYAGAAGAGIGKRDVNRYGRDKTRPYFYDIGAAYVRDLRRAIFTNDKTLFGILNDMTAPPRFDSYMDKNIFEKVPTDPYSLILCNPLDESLIMSLPEEIGILGLRTALDIFSERSEEFPTLHEIFLKYCAAHPGNGELVIMRAMSLLSSGRLGEAEAAATSPEASGNPERYVIRAVAALAHGEPDQALALFEAGLKELRRSSGRKKTVYDSRWSILYPMLLCREDDLQTQGERAKSEKKFQEYVESLQKANFHAVRDPLYALKFLAEGAKERLGIFDASAAKRLKAAEKSEDVLFFMLAAYWIDSDRARHYLPRACMACNRLFGMGRRYPAAELASIIREISPKSADKIPPILEPAHPLRDILSHKEDWQFALESLSGISAPLRTSPIQNGKRLVWQMDWQDAGDYDSYEITPVEQTLKGREWSAGRNISLKKMHNEAYSMESLTEHDRTAADAVRKRYADSSYYIEKPLILKLLAGHQNLCRSDGGKVEITLDEPRMTAICHDGEYVLKLNPFPKTTGHGTMMSHIAVVEDAPNCLRVIEFDERCRSIAAIVGENGLVLPENAREKLQKTLGELAGVVTIHSDVDGIESDAEMVAADYRLYIQVQPDESGLDVEAVTRPLGPESASCRPGIGGSNIFGLIDRRRVQAKRDLEREWSAMLDFAERCPAIREAEQLTETRWRISGPEISLEFLLQLQDMGEAITTEWPQGGGRRVKRVSSKSMNMTVRDSRDWFSVTGEVHVDENLVLGLKDIIKLMESAKGRFVPIGKNDFIALTEDFRRHLEMIAALAETRGDDLRISNLAAALMPSMASGLGSFEASSGWSERAALIDEAASLDPVLPALFKGELRSYQMDGYAWMSRLAHWGGGACLADDMGLGKTVQALAVLLSRAYLGPALVVAPTSVCLNWRDESARFSPALNTLDLREGNREATVKNLGPMDVLISSYGLLQNEIELLSSVRWNTIVLDEAQAIKNSATKRSAAAMKLDGDFRVMTTGTPIENNLGELWNLFRFINPGYLGSYESFNARFAVPIERSGNNAARKRLKGLIAPFVLRRTKEQVLPELPPKTEITLRVKMNPEERALYEAVRRNAVEELASAAGGEDVRFKIFAQLVRMRRACCNSALVLPEGSEPYPSAKLEAFLDIVDGLGTGGHRALVFSQFVTHLSILRTHLDEIGVSYQYLDGSTPPAERASRVKAFQSGDGVCFLISLKAGGTGLNLTAADYVIHMDPWWNPAVEEQASDRTHRIGQQRPVTIYRIVARDTIEERIVDLHAWKKDLAESLLDESDTASRLSADDMLRLIRAE
ncbi:MAG: DEAD/DEAH box helicase [Synergistaceae bacterium]|nr:DEAD/DEAH box helicase [Synergistaceae bacterium]